MATSGKLLGYFDGTNQLLAFLYYGFAALAGILFSVTSATACDQALFTPSSSVALIVVNLITGIVVWEDWKVLDTPIGYGCAIALMCCGVSLLASEDMIPEQASEWRRNHSNTHAEDGTNDALERSFPHDMLASAKSGVDEESQNISR